MVAVEPVTNPSEAMAIRSYLQAAIAQPSTANCDKVDNNPSSICSGYNNDSIWANDYYKDDIQNDENIRSITGSGTRASSAVIDATREGVEWAARDFGGMVQRRPGVVVYPGSVSDIARVVAAVWQSKTQSMRHNNRVVGDIGMANKVMTMSGVTARGYGHSIHGQAQAVDCRGVVVDMRSLAGSGMGIAVERVGRRRSNGRLWADVCAGASWTEVLKQTQATTGGLAPRAWTDYLHVTVGGTLQQGGIGGHTFKHGPQIANVLKLQVVTGTGEVKTCSALQNSDLFFATLGGLGQFGIITRARIVLDRAPQKVRWMRFVYADFKAFKNDQEELIRTAAAVDYIEGFIVSNDQDPITGWSQIPLPGTAARFEHRRIPTSAGPILYVLELGKHFNAGEEAALDMRVTTLLKSLHHVHGLCFQTDVTYNEFLERVHKAELDLRAVGLWQVPHPWLCLFVPASHMEAFDRLILRQKLSKGVAGPVLVYAMLRAKWDDRCSVVIPDADVFYVVAILRTSLPPAHGKTATSQLAENEEVMGICSASKLEARQYLPFFSRQCDWVHHFGSKWSHFYEMKMKWDPQAILSPGHNIFP